MIFFRLGRPGIRLFNPKWILVLLWLFLLVFPKGGFKLAGIPITWGYLLLGAITFFVAIRSSFTLQSLRIQALFLMLPFQVISLSSILLNGTDSISFAISFLLSFLFIPFSFFFILSKSIETLDLNLFLSLIKKGILLISIYGISLFIFKLTTGKLIEIPFLTVNYHDLGEIEFKCNERGFVFKLISTYNNGNIYGICLLMFLSLYCLLEKNILCKSLVKLSLILTFSRTVWIGLVANEILHDLFVSKNRKALLIKSLTSVILVVVFYFSMTTFFGYSADFIFDRNLGGRADQFEALSSCTLLPSQPFWGIAEITYLGILDQFGLVGLIFYLFAMFGPLFLAFFQTHPSPLRASILSGLFTYLFVAASDGALLLIPVLAFYWFCASLALRRNLAENIPLNQNPFQRRLG